MTPVVAVLDYGSGNLRSAQRALAHAGADVAVSADLDLAYEADGLVVPGVGAFAACAAGIRDLGAEEVISRRVRDRRPVLGVCVGMQVLFDEGVEHGTRTPGLGLLPGAVERLDAEILPHMGWNTVRPPEPSIVLAAPTDARYYFVHSYAATNLDALAAGCPLLPGEGVRITVANHGDDFAAAVETGWEGPPVLTATQFHPEKSSDAGAALLRRWVALLS